MLALIWPGPAAAECPQFDGLMGRIFGFGGNGGGPFWLSPSLQLLPLLAELPLLAPPPLPVLLPLLVLADRWCC